jgi:hypothetical protein
MVVRDIDGPDAAALAADVLLGTGSWRHSPRIVVDGWQLPVKPSAKPTQVRTLDLPPANPQVRPGLVDRALLMGAVWVTAGWGEDVAFLRQEADSHQRGALTGLRTRPPRA